MKALAFEKIFVLDKNGKSDSRSYISKGDLCEIGNKEINGLWPVTYPTSKGRKKRWIKTLNGFLCNQNKYSAIKYPARGYETATIKTSGCGVCSTINAIGALRGVLVDVQTMTAFSIGCGARVPGGTNMKTLLNNAAIRWGFRYNTTTSIEALKTHLNNGGVAICNVSGKGMFSTGGHYMTVLGITDGKLCIADCGLYAGKYNTTKRKAVAVSGDLVFASPSVLDEDCTGRNPKYYLLSKI